MEWQSQPPFSVRPARRLASLKQEMNVSPAMGLGSRPPTLKLQTAPMMETTMTDVMRFQCQRCELLMKTPGAGMTCLWCSAPAVLSDDGVKVALEYIRRMGLEPHPAQTPQTLTEWMMIYGR